MKFDKSLIGKQIKYPVKNGHRIETVSDIYITKNIDDKIIDVQYLTEFYICEQKVTSLRPYASIFRYMTK